MKAPTDSRSRLYSWYSFTFSPSTMRLKPVPTGSMKTRSDASRSENSLGTRRPGGGEARPSASRSTRRGPSTPKCSHTELDPGPPLNENVMGRFAFSSTPSSVYAMKKTRARAFSPSLLPSFSVSSFSTIVPQVTVYAISRRPMRPLCRVMEIWSAASGSLSAGLSAFFSSVSAIAMGDA